ncbi:glycosyltransferase [Candidatus Bathyarchaeota archaeon]|nr:glycosyltransferase [Candidatus Bathyarchaeota archaeon]
MRKLQHKKEACISTIVPTLNEERNIQLLLESIRHQSLDSETLVVDAKSKDRTVAVAHKYGAKTIILPGHGEFISRNIGAKEAKGTLLVFTCADIIFPKELFIRVINKFEKNPQIIALTGPGYAYDAPLFGKIEYIVYNLLRYFFAKLPKSLKRFSTSTNFLVVRKDYFEKTGGFAVDDINADGLMGRTLLSMGEVAFSLDTYFYLSARRMKNMGFLNFNKHYLYALENFFFSFSDTSTLKSIKNRSRKKHRKMREV